MTLQTQQKIVTGLSYLNSHQLAEVYDFIEFLRPKYKQKFTPSNTDIIDSLCGKYRDKLPSSEEFARAKQIEIKQEERKWQRMTK
ncbi:MAG: hypothetical protein BWK75_01525 [Candidatus Altiarchaeales archaeon A3]|nr:MAG: hypothetical protein BWK75_01525 [Candidatus Altiarchaeales archaeon A3]